jgi:hypothetical protein
LTSNHSIPEVKQKKAGFFILNMNHSQIFELSKEFENISPPKRPSKIYYKNRQPIPGVIFIPNQLHPRNLNSIVKLV